MKISKITIYHLSHKLTQPIIWSNGAISHRTTLLVKIETEDGVAGWGETTNIHAYPVIKDMSQYLIGKNVFNRHEIRLELISLYYNSKCVSGIVSRAISAIDIAIWDLFGKIMKLPICDLLGGYIRSKVAVYASGLYMQSDDHLKKEAKEYTKLHYTAVKMKIGYLDISEEVKRVALVRTVIGSDLKLMIDANQAYNVKSAVEVANRLKKYDIYWFEEPLSESDVSSYASLKKRTDMSIAIGENFHTVSELKEFLHNDLVDIAQPDVGNIGGVYEMLRAINAASMYRVNICPHAWGSPVLLSATLQMCAVIHPVALALNRYDYTQEPVLEYDCTENYFKEITDEEIRVKDSHIEIPMNPGIGININEEKLNKYILIKDAYCEK